MKGSFHAALKIKLEETVKERPEYGKRKVAPVDLRAAEKVRASDLQPFRMSMGLPQETGYEWLCIILAHNMGEMYQLRGGKEPSSLMASSFDLDVAFDGEFAGRKFLRLEDFSGNARC